MLNHQPRINSCDMRVTRKLVGRTNPQDQKQLVKNELLTFVNI